jgi:DNA-binding NarL/FixJ family response regulator
MIGKRSRRQESFDGARSFCFVHDGQELFVLSQPLQPEPAGTLTPAQLDVARAIVRGASNAEIARMRGTSVRTVANQVASILVRLGATSRAQIAVKLALVDLGGGKTG